MKIYDTFIKSAPNRISASILLGVLSAISYALLIPLVLASLKQQNMLLEKADNTIHTFLTFEVSNYPFAQLFLATCIFILVTKTLSQVLLTRVAMDITAQLRIKLYRQIAGASLRSVEKLGRAKLLAALTTDVPRIIFGAKVIPTLLISTVTLISMLSFLSYLNIGVFWFVIKCVFFGAVTYQIPMLFSKRYLRRARVHVDQLHEAIQGLIDGKKELKLNTAKREAYFKESLIDTEKKVLDDDKKGHTLMRIANNYGDMIGFFGIGAISYVFVNYHTIANQDLIAVIMVLLYITGPISNILAIIPEMSVARISQQKVDRLFKQLQSEKISAEKIAIGPWQKICFNGVSYRYQNEHNSFQVGPLNFEIEKGQITFIVGSNGSGKSTLSKLISQHYLPITGEIYFDDILINEKTLVSAREHMSVIYSDYYLFERIFGVKVNKELKQQVDKYLRALGLDKKVSFNSGRFSSLALSDGQKRRLALLVAYIEDKDFYLFDEWAADQDPMFKDIFYNQILQDLKAKNKLIVVITHDDRYFKVADQLIVMNEGQIVENAKPTSEKVIDYLAFNLATLPVVDELIPR